VVAGRDLIRRWPPDSQPFVSDNQDLKERLRLPAPSRQTRDYDVQVIRDPPHLLC